MLIHLADQEGNTSEHTLSSINERLEAGKLDPNTFAWKAGLKEWVPLRTIEGVSLPKPPPFMHKPKPPTQESASKENSSERLSAVHSYYQLPSNWKIKAEEKNNEKETIFSDTFLSEAKQAWPRFFGRFIDVYGLYIIAIIPGSLIFSALDLGSLGYGGIFAEVVIGYFLFLILFFAYEAGMLSWKGWTIGKLISGIDILTPEMQHLTFKEASTRTHYVIRSGCFYFILWPYIAIPSFLKYKRDLKDNKMLPWDLAVRSKVFCRPVSSLRYGVLIFTAFLLFFSHIAARTYQKMILKQELRSLAH